MDICPGSHAGESVMAPRCLYLVGGRNCRNRVTWEKLWPGNPYPCTRHKNFDDRACKGYEFSSVWVPYLESFEG